MSGEDGKIGPYVLGGGLGLVLGAAMGSCFALMASSYSNGMVWFVVPHITIAMVLMGLWLVPCLMTQTEEPQEQASDSADTARRSAGSAEKANFESHTAA